MLKNGNYLRARRGSFTLEAAIFLPIFILSALTIAYLIKLIAVQENAFHALADETRKIAAEAAMSPFPVFFKGDVLARIGEENGGELENLRVARFDYRYGLGEYTEQIRVTVDYDIGVKLPAALISAIPVSDTILCRAFVGAINADAPMSNEELEEEKTSRTVWVFPRAGTKYHGEACSYVAVYPKELLLGEGVRRRYAPCKLCDPGSLPTGSVVYCFQSTGKAFHRGDCASVDRYVIPMELEEAEARGYTPCAKCGGY
ncbi:MAG: hypothetical protein LBP30_06320 [Clostridiales Family XIII bacterium]|jgi:hypothetical protein|nr:hypothetical protein [Clostridiales Family XIII bacterium]